MSDLSTEEERKNNKRLRARFVLNQGTFMGLALAGVYLFVHLVGMMDSFLQNVLSWIVFIGFIHFSMVRYRENFLGGYLSYGQGVWMGTRMGMLAGIIIGAYMFLYIKVINPGYIEAQIIQMQEAYLAMGMSENEVAQMDGMLSLAANPVLLIFSGILVVGFSALIFSLIIAIFQRRKDDPFSDAMKNVE